MKHAHNKRWISNWRVNDNVRKASHRKKADRRRCQLRFQCPNPRMLADDGRQLVEGHSEALGCRRILTCDPLDDFKDVSFSSG